MNTMKRLFLGFVSLVAVTSLVSPVVSAQESQPMTEAHMERIKSNCSDALSTIQQLHTSDGPLFVNRWQQYEPMSSKLMSRLNSRLALNKMDGSALVKITADYDKALSLFRADYKQYDDHMSGLLTIDCRRQPVKFYDEVTKARQLREAVHRDVLEMHRLLMDYQKSFDAFYQQFRDNPASGDNN